MSDRVGDCWVVRAIVAHWYVSAETAESVRKRWRAYRNWQLDVSNRGNDPEREIPAALVVFLDLCDREIEVDLHDLAYISCWSREQRRAENRFVAALQAEEKADGLDPEREDWQR